MARPQQQELARAGRTALDPDSFDTEVQVQPRAPRDEGAGGPVPEDNRPGHHPEAEQDKPDVEAFAARARGETRPPMNDLLEERSGVARAALMAAGAVGAAVGFGLGVAGVMRRRRR